MIAIIIADVSGERFSNKGYMIQKTMVMIDRELMILKVKNSF